jgi:hypothetical protein
MKWVDYTEEQRKSSKDMKETNDCTVFAWCNVFDAPYVNSHGWLRKHGRQKGRGMLAKAIKAALAACKKSTTKVGPYSNKDRISVASFCRKHPVGRYYVWNRNHAFAIKDGVVYDHHHGPRRQITGAVRVYLEGEL